MTKVKDYYDVLGVSRTASQKEISSAFRKLARKYHPDVNQGDKDAERRFKEASEAHVILSDDATRKYYDASAAFRERALRGVLHSGKLVADPRLKRHDEL